MAPGLDEFDVLLEVVLSLVKSMQYDTDLTNIIVRSVSQKPNTLVSLLSVFSSGVKPSSRCHSVNKHFSILINHEFINHPKSNHPNTTIISLVLRV